MNSNYSTPVKAGDSFRVPGIPTGSYPPMIRYRGGDSEKDVSQTLVHFDVDRAEAAVVLGAVNLEAEEKTNLIPT